MNTISSMVQKRLEGGYMTHYRMNSQQKNRDKRYNQKNQSIRRYVMSEKLYKSLNRVGGWNIAFGIIMIVCGVAIGIIQIVNGAKLLSEKKDITF